MKHGLCLVFNNCVHRYTNGLTSQVQMVLSKKFHCILKANLQISWLHDDRGKLSRKKSDLDKETIPDLKVLAEKTRSIFLLNPDNHIAPNSKNAT